jgi:hypothetical protein
MGGKKLSESQEHDMEQIFGSDAQHKNLDYICGFFRKGASFLRKADALAFVATTSINQGTHVPTLWPGLLADGIEIFFSYEPFHWSNNAAKNAGVTCTILGLRRRSKEKKSIFSHDSVRLVRNINPYLVDGPDLIVEPRSQAISALPRIITGNAAYDGGHFFLTADERQKLVSEYPQAEQFLLRCAGTTEFIDGVARYCLWIEDADVAEACAIEPIRQRIEGVRQYRENGGEVARTLVDIPYRFRYTNRPSDVQILVPQVSSERREYIPIGLLDRSTIITHLAFAVYEPDISTFAILNSKLHNAWSAMLCGRMRKDFRYSTTIVYNTFPLPPLSHAQRETLEQHGWQIISARETHPGKSIAWLYDPDTMPDNLRDAHHALDDSLERIYLGRSFKSDSERREHLLKLYAEMTSDTEKEVASA